MPLADLARQLQDFAPTVLITYPSCAAALAQLEAAGTQRQRLSEIWLGGEQWSAEQRGHIRSRFGCTLRNHYGTSEFFPLLPLALLTAIEDGAQVTQLQQRTVALSSNRPFDPAQDSSAGQRA